MDRLPNDKPPSHGGGVLVGASLVSLIGAAAAAMLFTDVPREESGRVVEAVPNQDNSQILVRHVKGKQYLKAYLDIAGVPTACDGIIRGVRMGQKYTEKECLAKLEQELVIHTRGMLQCSPGFDPKANPYQTVALVSFTYNLGVGAYCGSSVRKNVVAGRMVQACDRLLPWNKARVGGVLRPVKGLTYRRNRERQYCLTNLVPGHTPENLKHRLRHWK